MSSPPRPLFICVNMADMHPPAASSRSARPTLDELSLGNAAVDEADYDVVFYLGRHGSMEDLAFDEVSGELLKRHLRAGLPLALLCHTPVAAGTRYEKCRVPLRPYAINGDFYTGQNPQSDEEFVARILADSGQPRRR